MPESDQPADVSPTETTVATEATPRNVGRSVARVVRLLATPAAIVVAWIVVVTQWNQSDTNLFIWATITAGIVLAVVTALWFLSLKFPALRRALLPFEGGLVVGAVILAGATTGYEVDTLGDRIAIAITFGVVTALLLAFMQQLVAGRDRAWAWLAGIVVLCAAAGVAVPATLDWLDGSTANLPYTEEILAGELVARAGDGGFRLDDVAFVHSAPPLGEGYVDEPAPGDMGVYTEPAVAIDPATDEPVATGALAPTATSVGEDVRNDWAKLVARPDGSLRVAVEPGIARGVTKRLQGSLRRGDCKTTANSKELDGFSFTAGDGRVFERTLPIDVDDLRLDDELSLIVGTAKPLAPTRCVQLLTASGIALAQLGAGTFVEDCLDPLDLPRGDEYLVRPSSFQDVTCATRFAEYSDISSSILVTRDDLDEYRECRHDREARRVVTERKLPHGARAFAYRDSMFSECVQFAANESTYTMFGMGTTIDPATMPPVRTMPGPAAPTTNDPAAPPAPGVASEDLDGLTPEELAAKVR